jgi:purine-binding chemotaxis protein CheW
MDQLHGISSQIGFATDGNQYLTFTLGHELYAVELLKVQEIRGYSAMTPIPNTPREVKGVMNLRGAVIPIVDLRIRLGMPSTEYNRFTVIIIAKVGTRTMGLIVDAVSDVLKIPTSDVQPTTDFGTQVDARFVSGVAKVGEKLVVVLDVDKALGGDDLAAAAG